MKCIRFTKTVGLVTKGKIVRCPDANANRAVKDGAAKFCSKREWKEQRDGESKGTRKKVEKAKKRKKQKSAKVKK